MDSQHIRIRLKAFDHRVLDQSAKEIVGTAKDPEFRFHGYMEVVEPWGGSLRERLPLQDRWGEALRYR